MTFLNSKQTSKVKDGVFYYSHIPKTGGTSLTSILDRYFNVEEIFKPQLWWDVGSTSAVREKNYRFFRGHFGMGAQVLSNQPFNTLTLIRSPLRMAYSTYQYIKREPNTGKHHYVNSKQLSFEAFVQDPQTQNLCKNRLLKSLSFGSSMLKMDKDLVITPDNYKSSRKYINEEVKSSRIDQICEMVKAYIDSLYWIGVLEDFDRSLMLLNHKMALPVVGDTEKLNKHPHNPQITEKAARIVNEINQFDNEIYAYGKSKFENEFNQTFRQQLNANDDTQNIIDAIDERYQKHRSIKTVDELPERIEFQFTMPLIGQNWHSREWNQSDLQCFRWTGPGKKTTIDFWMDPNDYLIEINYLNIVDQNLLEDLLISINESNVKWRNHSDGCSGKLIIFCGKTNCCSNGLLRLEMKTKALKRHHDMLNSNDYRRVGMAVKSIIIKKQG